MAPSWTPASLPGLAAGALFFVLAPIQRLADRIDEEAIPGDGATHPEPAEAIYRRTVEMDTTDGNLPAEDGHELGQLAPQRGVVPERAREPRQEANTEIVGGKAP